MVVVRDPVDLGHGADGLQARERRVVFRVVTGHRQLRGHDRRDDPVGHEAEHADPRDDDPRDGQPLAAQRPGALVDPHEGDDAQDHPDQTGDAAGHEAQDAEHQAGDGQPRCLAGPHDHGFGANL